MHYFLNIGSNIGNRKLNISRALKALEEEFGYFEVSKLVESRPWGYVSDKMYYNIAIMVISDKEPLQMLNILQGIENRLNPTPHRDASGNYQDRVLDIDIMAADEISLDSDNLTLPHPALAERRFFLEPFAELAPLWRHPLSGKTCAEMLADLPTEKEESKG